MFRLVWIASIHTRDFLHRYMPTNIVLDRLRTRHGLKWGDTCMLCWCTFSAKSVRGGAVMSGVAGVGVDERRARVMLAEPDDPVTGGLMRRLGAVETLGLLDTDTTVPGLGRVDGQVWRDRLASPGMLDRLDQRLRMVEESGIATLIPGDAQWTRALDSLGERAPYVLFVRGTPSFLARPLNELVTVTGSRAASAYGEHVAGELAGDLANRERVLVAGGTYGVEAAVHRAVLAAGGDTIAVGP